MKRVLVACEFSATVRDAFRARGFDAWSCDLLPTEGDPRWHIQGDVRHFFRGMAKPWDLLIAHPPCTHLAVSGARWFKDKRAEQQEALGFVADLFSAPIKHVALENPVSIISSRFRKPDQTIQPWQFGHGETKATCLWLVNLPKLKPTNIVEGREARVHKMPPGPDRWKERSRTFQGIAEAMAQQWGDYLINEPAPVTPRQPAASFPVVQMGGAQTGRSPFLAPEVELSRSSLRPPYSETCVAPAHVEAGDTCASGLDCGGGSSSVADGLACSFHSLEQ